MKGLIYLINVLPDIYILLSPQKEEVHLLGPALLYLFISSDASTCSTVPFSPLGKSDHVVVSVSIDFP